MRFWWPLRKTDLRCLRLRIDDWLALGVHQHRFGPDVHVAAPQSLACELNELLRVLWGVEHGGELANRTPP